MKSLALTALLLAAVAAPAMAQTSVRLSGRILHRGADTGLAGVTVAVAGQSVTTDIQGHFDFDAVLPGRHLLRVTAFGYSQREVPILIERDTSIIIELDPEPIPLDSLVAAVRTATLRGEVYEADMGLIDVDVYVGEDHAAVTNPHGRFRIDVPAGPPFRLSVHGFGYTPIESIVSIFADTTLIIQLEPDPLIQQMIREQVERLEERALPFTTAFMPPIDRDYLLRNRDGTVYELLRRRYGPNLERVECVVIDDRQRYTEPEQLTHYYPDQLERIAVLERGRVLRIYTRDYLRRMIGGGVDLVKPYFRPRKGALPALCR